MSTEFPYTYTDRHNDVLEVGVLSGHMCIQARETFNGQTRRATVYVPQGDDAVELARAVLDAPGDTGHVVIDAARLASLEKAFDTLLALEAAGVDNWSGYDDAVSLD